MEMTDAHDPVDLLVEFQRKPEKFSWEYLERGPEVWRVRVVRRRAPATTDVAAALAADPEKELLSL